MVDLGGLAEALASCLCPGRKWAMAILFLVTTRRVLCSPCHFNPRVAPRVKGIGADFRPWQEETPTSTPTSSSCPAAELRTLCSVSFPTHPLPSPVLHSQPGSPILMVYFGPWFPRAALCLL